MKGSRCLFNSAAALRRVFVGNALPSEGPWQMHRLILPLASSSRAAAPSSQLRGFVSSAPLSANRGGAKKQLKLPADRYPRDRNIDSPWIQLRDEETGRLLEPERTRDVLARIDLKNYSLVTLMMPKVAGEEGEDDTAAEGDDAARKTGNPYPVCRIIDRRAEYAEALAKNKEERKQNVSTKEVEINWAIDPHDLQTRLRQVKGFLNDGFKVEITMQRNPKKRKKVASADEARETYQTLRAAIADVPGTTDVKPPVGTVGTRLQLVLQGPPREKSAKEPKQKPEKQSAIRRRERAMAQNAENGGQTATA
ncbi:hypothetical protein B0T26DRAFT_697465 [Lasiosphaeria miniovina]|uniref:Translation initiation factor 3 N-terminal domain-containing protein n=1 Tax=Lasiosphaeria miniovina TaxID=1954250 RepID=A0AA40B5X9_9PEZI|nr:uncharacterized protein B0T26DRAFT_697465 [Lasiosphaeria miniovina]KAK0728277.1 hypothetical protein B0T26DRAFT_697465 [Lasiosphaeria miniovina]